MIAVTMQPADAGAAPAATEVAVPVVARLPSLRRNFAVTLAGNVVYAACQWGILVVLAKLISPEMVGQFVLGVAVAAPVFFLANLQLGNIQATDAKRQTPFETYLRLRLLTTLAGCVALAAIVAVCGYSGRTAAVILVIGAAKALDALSDIFHGLYQQQERMHLITGSLMTNAFASLAGTALALWLTEDVVWAAVAFALGSLAALALYNLPVGAAVRRAGATRTTSLPGATLGGPWDWGVLGRLAWLGAPVGVAAALVSLNGTLPRYFMERYHGEAALADFGLMAYVMTAGVTFVGALCASAVPRLARRYADGDLAGFYRLLGKILLVAAAAGVLGLVVALVAGRQLLSIVYRPEYARHAGAFSWLMLAALVAYVGAALGYAVNAARAFRQMVLPYAAVAASTLVACWLLVPRYGIRGAAWAVGVSSVATCLGSLWILARLPRRPGPVSERVE